MEKICSVCSHKLQKRKCGFVCKNWRCIQFASKFTEQQLDEKLTQMSDLTWSRIVKEYLPEWRKDGFLGRCWVGNKLWLVTPTEIKEVMEEDW